MFGYSSHKRNMSQERHQNIHMAPVNHRAGTSWDVLSSGKCEIIDFRLPRLEKNGHEWKLPLVNALQHVRQYAFDYACFSHNEGKFCSQVKMHEKFSRRGKTSHIEVKLFVSFQKAGWDVSWSALVEDSTWTLFSRLWWLCVRVATSGGL